MQVRISPEGQFTIPPSLRKQLGMGVEETWMEVEVKQGVLQATIVPQPSPGRPTAKAQQPQGRMQALKPHPEALRDSGEELDKVSVWDEADWANRWDSL